MVTGDPSYYEVTAV